MYMYIYIYAYIYIYTYIYIHIYAYLSCKLADRAGSVSEDADDRVVEEDHVVEEGDRLPERGLLQKGVKSLNSSCLGVRLKGVCLNIHDVGFKCGVQV